MSQLTTMFIIYFVKILTLITGSLLKQYVSSH